MGWWALIASAATGGVNAASSVYAAKKQSETANRAAASAQRAGESAQSVISGSLQGSRDEINAGVNSATGEYRRADDLLAAGQQANQDIFAQERSVGSSALGRLQDALLNGNQNAVQLDPGYQFRLAEGNKAIERAAAAAGSFGSGGNLKDFARFSQGLASDEYGKAIARLSGLAAMGSNANANLASLNSGILGQRANVGSALASTYTNQGNTLANLIQNNVYAQANALNNTSTNVNNYNLQAANAIANGATGVTNAVNQGTQNALLWSLINQPSSTANTIKQPVTTTATR